MVKKTEDSIAFLKSKPKPLAIYAFTNDEKLKQRIIAKTSSGSVTFNDAIVQMLCVRYGLDNVSFGGVGQSGFGQYHGPRQVLVRAVQPQEGSAQEKLLDRAHVQIPAVRRVGRDDLPRLQLQLYLA
ncbi:hypothetical protein GUJ93_ZPchr0002g23318 [Zizania palustris]|uniref:Aldehyde dehydrogenase domain-containing protein n=1 Tax=Zizania palustris TaxID=103762 RepID=A0A8J5S303_ZIZPA|nr:hypothetical protein GUJ93_ZPchr0002g23318 [Zizania palustris]